MKDEEKRRLSERCRSISEREIEEKSIKELNDEYSPWTPYSTFRKYLKVFGGDGK